MTGSGVCQDGCMPFASRFRLRAAARAAHLAALGASVVALALLPACAQAQSHLEVGFLDNAYAGGDPSAYWNDAIALNAGFARWDVNWREIAPSEPPDPSNPADPAYRWSQTDAFVRGAAAHGLSGRVLFTVWMTPPWASDTARPTQMPRLADWRAFVRACATRYSGTYTPPGQSEPLPRVTAWEAWNEPNSSWSLKPQRIGRRHVGARNYVKLLHSLEQEVTAQVDFKPTFVAGSLYKQAGRYSTGPIDFMREMKAAHATFDVLSMHPYNNFPRLGMADGAGQSKKKPKYMTLANVQDYIAIANAIFKKRYPIWITEVGLPTVAPGKTQYAASYGQQRTYVTKAIAKVARIKQVKRFTWFLIRDDPPRPFGAWWTTGLRTSSGEAKPSFAAFAAATAKLQPSPIK